MSNCSKHQKEILGVTDMKELAEMIGDLHYETLSELLYQISKKIKIDGIKDTEAGREKLGQSLYIASRFLISARDQIEQSWQISKPFMEGKQSN